MTKERAHTANATGAALTIAQNEMVLANRAHDAGDQAGCKMHTQNALNALK